MKKSVASLLLLGFILFGCSNPVNVGPDLTPGINSKSTVATGAWTQSESPVEYTEYTGELGPGASYYIYIPDDWNNQEDDLVLYAHGYVFPPELTAILPEPLQKFLPTPHIDDDLRDGLLGADYAVAYSTFSEDGDGYALKEGAIRTRQLRGIFTSKVGKPEHIYLIGYSLGGAISLMLAEKNPNLFSGALLVSGFVGGGQMQIDYVLNAYLLFKRYFGILPDVLEIPEKYTVPALVLLADAVQNALLLDIADTGGATIAKMLSVSADGVPVFQASAAWGPPEMDKILEAILSPLVFSLFGTNDLLDRTHDHVPFDNTETLYYSAVEEQFLDLPQFEATPDAANYLKHWYEPTGKLKIPVVTLHNEYDPIVPYYQEAVYEDKVSDAGSSDMLKHLEEGEEGEFPLFGHCNFEPGDIIYALEVLKEWPWTD